LYNYTEATFNGVSNIWIILFLGIMDRASRQESPNKLDNVKENI